MNILNVVSTTATTKDETIRDIVTGILVNYPNRLDLENGFRTPKQVEEVSGCITRVVESKVRNMMFNDENRINVVSTQTHNKIQNKELD